MITELGVRSGVSYPYSGIGDFSNLDRNGVILGRIDSIAFEIDPEWFLVNSGLELDGADVALQHIIHAFGKAVADNNVEVHLKRGVPLLGNELEIIGHHQVVRRSEHPGTGTAVLILHANKEILEKEVIGAVGTGGGKQKGGNGRNDII